jgi:hypothetical protein
MIIANALISNTIQKRSQIYILSVDLRGMFGNMHRDLVKTNANQVKILKCVKKIILGSYEKTFINMQIKNRETDAFLIGKGVKHRCSLSSILFNLEIDPLIKYLSENYNEFGFSYIM